MRRHILLFLSVCSLLGSASAQTDSFVMQRALQGYTEAYGGGRDVDALSSISVEGTQEQDGKVYDFLLRKKRPNMIRYRLSHGENSVISAYDGRSAWMQTEQAGEIAVRKLTRVELSALKVEAAFETPLFKHLEDRSHRVEMSGREIVDGRETYVFVTQAQGGLRCRYFLDARRPHILKKERLGPKDVVELTVLYRDYKEVDGYPFAFEVETQVDGQVVSLVKVSSISANPGLLSFYFRMPNK
ncbi:MAG: hypothetical protein ACSHYA_09765 [Opitutaceae bacterium]